MKSTTRWASLLLLIAGCRDTRSELVPIQGRPSQSATEVTVADEDWPWWLGTNGNGNAVGQLPPLTWSDERNVLWRTRIPGVGHATPILWGNQIFISTAEEENKTQSLLTYDRKTGNLQWTTVVHRNGYMRKHHRNSHASSTPACDGERVYVAYAAHLGVWVSAIDLEGNIVWQTEAGPAQSDHGYGSSPVLYKSLIIVTADVRSGSFITALDRLTGKIVWRTLRGRGSSYGTPKVAKLAGRDQLLLAGAQEVNSYDPESGKRIWWCHGPAKRTANTVAWWGDMVIATGGYPQQAVLAIRADGSGDVSDTHVQWKDDLKQYVPSPLVVGNRLVAVRDNGVIQCLDLETGERLWRRRLGGDFFASPVAVGSHVFVPNAQGTTFVFRVEDKFELVSKNDLGQGCYASPVICDGQLFLRTEQELFCIDDSTRRQ